MPRRHRRDLTNLRRFHIPTESGRVEPIVAAIFAQICRVSRQGDDWRDVIDSMRPVTPQLWKCLETDEKRRFLREFQRLWDVHRFRMAPDVADRFEALQASGRIAPRPTRSSRWSRTGTGSASSCGPRRRTGWRSSRSTG